MLHTSHTGFTVAIALTLGAVSAASAQSCEKNFSVEGTPQVTAVNFRSWQSFPGLDQARALRNLQQGLAAEGFLDVSVDRSLGALTAMQETSGSGRPQTLRVVARKSGNATRVDAVFMIQPGQTAAGNVVRGSLCRVISSAAM
jgi:hypothetical protein